MRGVSRKLIESLAESDVGDFAEATEGKVTALVSLAISDMAVTIPFINPANCILQPVNELFNGSVSPESEYIYFLGIESPQIEINCMQYNDWWKKFKERWIYAWNSSKKKKKKKRKKKDEDSSAPYVYDAEKYNMDKLVSDLQTAFVRNLTETSIVYNEGKFLKVIGRDEFGPKTQIYIYPTLFEDGNFKFFINRKKGFYKINFETRSRLIQEKYAKVGDNLVKMIRILNSLFRNSSRSYIVPNQIYIESLLYNTPDELFKGTDIYEVFIKIINYLNFTSVSEFKSILNPETKLDDEKATKSNIVVLAKLLNGLNEIKD